MFLIIFAWTPPHFWALALYRREEYAKVGMPMLPVTHGEAFTLATYFALYRDFSRSFTHALWAGHERFNLFSCNNHSGRHFYGLCDWPIPKIF